MEPLDKHKNPNHCHSKIWTSSNSHNQFHQANNLEFTFLVLRLEKTNLFSKSLQNYETDTKFRSIHTSPNGYIRNGFGHIPIKQKQTKNSNANPSPESTNSPNSTTRPTNIMDRKDKFFQRGEVSVVITDRSLPLNCLESSSLRSSLYIPCILYEIN